MAVEDFEQLIFILNHGLDDLLARVEREGHSTDELDIEFGLANKTKRRYEIRTSFPTLEKAFWLKLINLRVSLDAPEAGILSLDVTARFTRPRPTQKGLYAAKRPEPESLLLTVGKLKKLVGDENVGTPTLLDQRLYKPFALDAAKIPDVHSEQRPGRLISGETRFSKAEHLPHAAPPPGGIAPNVLELSTEKNSFSANKEAQPQDLFKRPVIAFSHYKPPVGAEVLVRSDRLVYIRTRNFSGHILNASGVWRSNSKWWDKPWRTQEWDIEVEDYGIYRLCKTTEGWLLVGEYD
jgi:protein ImuB